MCGQIEEADGAVLEHCLIAASDIGGVRSMVVFSLSVHNILFQFLQYCHSAVFLAPSTL